jgi:hypothetical protein
VTKVTLGARWSDDYHRTILGAFSFAAVHWGRRTLRQCWSNWPQLHASGMGVSYILLLGAFHIDNGKNPPLWQKLPQIAFWPLPNVIGAPIILYVLRRHLVIPRTNIRL